MSKESKLRIIKKYQGNVKLFIIYCLITSISSSLYGHSNIKKSIQMILLASCFSVFMTVFDNFTSFNLQLEIIDACVNYIEALQEQLNIRNPEEHNNSTDDIENDENTMSTSIRSLMSAFAEDQVEDRLHSVQDDEMDDYLNSASSEEDYTEDEVEEDSNNNNENITSKDINKVEENTKPCIDSSNDNTMKTETHKDNITDKESSRS